MNSVIVGMFDSQAAASQARTHLLSAGFASDAVMLTGGDAGAYGAGSSTATGSMTGTGTGVADSVSETAHHAGGAISRFFHNLFGSDDDTADDRDRSGYTDTYNEAFRRGSYGVSVNVANDDETDRAERILNDAGAVDIDEKAASWRQEGWMGGASGASVGTAAGAVAQVATQKLQEVEEELKVGKRAVARGGLRVFKRLIETPVEESVSLREEHATIARRTVDRPATEADFAAFKEGSIEVRETGEEAVVSKTARVTGEVEIGKTVTEREEVVRDTVRKTQVEVEEIAGGSTKASSGSAYTGASGTTGLGGSGVDTSTGTDLGSTSGTRMP